MDAVDRASFRRDPYLRSSASHLAIWSLAACALEMRRHAEAGFGAPDIAILAGSMLASFTQERRIGKMAGVAGEAIAPAMSVIWSRGLMLLALASAAFIDGGRADLLFDLWCFGVGSLLRMWGRAARFRWYFGLGVALVAAALADLLLQTQGADLLAFRILVLGLALPLAALETNRRYLWFRPD